MVHRRTLDAILGIVVAWAVLFTAPFFVPQIAWPLNLQIGIVVTAALAIFSVVYFYPSRTSPVRSVFQTFFGGDELLKELERVGASCARLSGNLGASGEQIHPQIMELDRLWLELDVMRTDSTRHWSASVLNSTVMVVDQLRKASTALGERNIEQTRAHIDGAARSTQALIRELKAPPQVNTNKTGP